MSTKAARTITRDEPAMRTPNRDQPAREPERDPNKIYNRHGVEINPNRMATGAEDRFAFDRAIIPQGWDYQWKTKTIKNWEWVDHQVELANNGWTAVPAERHDGVFMPRGFTGNVERGGLILMERDMRLTIRARAMDKREADTLVQESRQMAGMMGRMVPQSSAETVDFNDPSARNASGVRVDRQPRVAGGTYNYNIDE